MSPNPTHTPTLPEGGCAELLPTILGEIGGVLARLDATALDRLAASLASAGHVLVAGEGRSGFMARAFAMRLTHLGLAVHVIGETTTPAVRAGDLLVAVSGSGSTAATLRAVEQAAAVGARAVAVTTDPASALATTAHEVVVVPAATKHRRPGEAATIQPLSSLFDHACHVAFDAVCLAIAVRKGISNDTAKAAHANTE